MFCVGNFGLKIIQEGKNEMDFISFIKDTLIWLTIPLGVIYIIIWIVVIWVISRMFSKN